MKYIEIPTTCPICNSILVMNKRFSDNDDIQHLI